MANAKWLMVNSEFASSVVPAALQHIDFKKKKFIVSPSGGKVGVKTLPAKAGNTNEHFLEGYRSFVFNPIVQIALRRTSLFDMTPGATAASNRNLLFIGLSVLLFLLACATPCLEMSQKSDPTWYGLRILVLGWMGVLVGQFAWLANPLWLLGLITFALRKWRVALIALGASLLFAANTLLLFVMPLPADESNINHTSLVRLRIGFYL